MVPSLPSRDSDQGDYLTDRDAKSPERPLPSPQQGSPMSRERSLPISPRDTASMSRERSLPSPGGPLSPRRQVASRPSPDPVSRGDLNMRKRPNRSISAMGPAKPSNDAPGNGYSQPAKPELGKSSSVNNIAPRNMLRPSPSSPALSTSGGAPPLPARDGEPTSVSPPSASTSPPGASPRGRGRGRRGRGLRQAKSDYG